jgi:hypothetical protein
VHLLVLNGCLSVVESLIEFLLGQVSTCFLSVRIALSACFV